MKIGMKQVRKIHKWVSLVVGIQLLLWLGTGLYFNVMDHKKVSGNQYRQAVDNTAKFDYSRLLTPADILVKAEPATSIKLIGLLNQPYYLVNYQKGLYAHFKNRYQLFHAYSGEPLAIDKAFATKLAKQSYSGSGEVSSVHYIAGKLDDLPKQKNSSWQVNFSDSVNTSVYIEAESGRVVGHSDDDKRFAGIFFMLHFMDYQGEGSFNNWQIMLFAFITLWLTFSGAIWTVDLVRKGRYRLRP